MGKLGRFCARHHWWVIGGWLLVLIVVGTVAGRLGPEVSDDFAVPGTDSQKALDVLEADFPQAAGASANVVYHATGGKKISDFDSAINDTVAALEKVDDVVLVADPTQVSSLVSSDGTIAYSTVQFDKTVAGIPKDSFDDLEEATKPATDAGLQVELGGGVVDTQNIPQNAISEYADEIGLVVAAIILLIAFGSVLHMAMPIASAVFGVLTFGSAVILLEHGATISTVAPILGTMIGLGVGVDYALFITTRFREALTEGEQPVDAAGLALDRAGRAVLFAGITVTISTSALVLVRIPVVGTMGLVAAASVVLMVSVSLTFLPAILGLSRDKILKWRIPFLGEKDRKTDKQPFFTRLANGVADKPWLFGGIALVVLLVLAAPVLKMKTGFTDDGDAPTDTTQRKAYDLMTEGFGAGVNGPLLVVVETDPDKDESSTVDTLATDIGKTDGVASVTPPVPAQSKKADLLIVTPTSGPASSATDDLVHFLRDQVIPTAVSGSDIAASDVHVGGGTAINIDLTQRVDDRLPYFMAAVIGGAFLLLMAVYRSLLIPLKAAVMNLLSIGAAYGIVVAIFQWGWLRDVIGLEQPIKIWSFVPLMMFSILFGLSMDYEVFLMSRIQEEYLERGSPRASVVDGITHTARVISSAALVMMAVFLSFVTNQQPVVKMIGLGLAAAVFVDATIVRLVLVPSVMEIMGARAWWFPKWLDRIVPHISVEGPKPG